MTSKERLLVAFGGGEPDRVPVSPFGLGKIPADSSLAEELIARTDILIDCGAPGDPFAGKAARNRTEDGPDLTTIVIETPSGPLTQRIKRTSVTSATVEFPFKTTDDVERFLSMKYEPPDIDISGYNAWVERIGDEGLVLAGICDGVCLPASWFSPEDFCLAWADMPDVVASLTDLASQRLNRHVERLCQAGVKAFRIIGGEYVSVQLGPAAFAELISPYDSELVDIIHHYGGIAYYHNHGRVMDYLPALADLGIDALDPLEAPPWGDVDLAGARLAAGDRLCFVGNLDDMEIVDALPAEEVVEIAAQRARAAGSRAFVLGGTASGTYGERGARAFMAMADAMRQHSLQ